MLGYRPLVYMWIAEYIDGSALPQFDPETGRENRFADIDHGKLKRFGWYPFTHELAKKILETEGIIVIPVVIPSYVVELKDGERLVAKRENTIKLHTKSGEITRDATVYVLGKEGDKILRIHEDGSVE